METEEGEKKTHMDIFQVLTHTPLDLELQSHLARCIHTTQRESWGKKTPESDSQVSCFVSEDQADELKITHNSRKHPVAYESKHL